MNTFRLPGAVSLSFRSLESPFHGSPGWNRTLSRLSCGPSLPDSFSRLPGRYLPRINMISLQRSLSLSSTSSSKTVAPGGPEASHSEAADLLTELRSPFPNADFTPTAPQPPWMQELMHSHSGRQSRASSIVSTRTRFSTTTVDDARADTRSIDVHVGGQYFRISRDGSRITDELPPPYSGPESSLRLSSRDALASRSSSISVSHGSRSRSSSVFDEHYNEDSNETDDNITAIQGSPPDVRANILDPSEVDMPSPVDGNRGEVERVAESDTPERNPSYKAGPEVISVSPDTRKRRTVSENLVFPNSDSHICRITSPLRRRNGVRLPSLVTESLNARLAATSSRGLEMQSRQASTSPVAVRSAGPVLMSSYDENIPASPTYIGRNARAIFPRTDRLDYEGLNPTVADTSTRPVPQNVSDESGDEQTTPPAMDTENDISLHYARLMRRLDRDHRKALHLKDKDLEKLRERLNEVDTVYRQELRARDFMIDDLRKRLSHLQETQEARMEKARNEVEDLWESRWQDKHSQLRERMRRIEEEVQRSLPKGVTLAGNDFA